MRYLSVVFSLLVAVGVLAAAFAEEPAIGRRPTASISADQESVAAGSTITIAWKGANGTATLNDEAVGLTGSKQVTVNETTTWTFKVAGKRRSATDSVTVEVQSSEDATDNPQPEPVDGFSLSAVGIGSAFAIDDALSAASRDKELGAFLASQNGTWTIVTDEVMGAAHPKAFDAWAEVLAKSGKAKPAVIWHDQGKVLAVDEVAGKSKAELLAMAKSHVPATADKVVIRGKVRELGLKPAKKGAKYSGLSVSAILKPLAAKDCPSVDLSSQVLYYKDQTAGTCVLNTFAGACEAAIYCAYGKANTVELSPYFLANLTDGYNGTWAVTAAEAIQKHGNLPFGEVAPYGKLPAGWQTKAAGYKCLAVYGPPESDSPGYIRAALHRGYIVCAGISCGSGFDPDSDGYISYDRGAGRYVNHEIRVVGWDQQKRRFLIANSWGKSWGINGGAWLDEKFFTEDTDLWVVVGMVANPAYQFYAPVDGQEPAIKQLPTKPAGLLEVPIAAAVEAATEPVTSPMATVQRDEPPCANGKCAVPSKLLRRRR